MSLEPSFSFHLKLPVLIPRRAKGQPQRIGYICRAPRNCASERIGDSVSLGSCEGRCLVSVPLRRCVTHPGRSRAAGHREEIGAWEVSRCVLEEPPGRRPSLQNCQCLITTPLPPHTPTGQCHSVTKEGNVLCRPRVLPGIVSGRRGQERRPSHPTQIAFGWSHKPGALAPWIGEEALECFICPSSCAEMIETQKARSWESSHGCSSVHLTSRMLEFPWI